MKLDKKTLSAVGESLDQHNVSVDGRQLRFVIDGVDYCLDAAGCRRFSNHQNELGWNKCALPEVLTPFR